MGDMQSTSAVITTAPQPGHYDIDPGLAARYLDLTVAVQCTRS